MNHPLFEIHFEEGPFDGLALTANFLPDGHLALPARPDRTVNLGHIHQSDEGPRAHYDFVRGAFEPGHEVPVVGLSFRFRGIFRCGDGVPRAAGWRGRIRRLLDWFTGRRRSATTPFWRTIAPAAGKRRIHGPVRGRL